MRGGGTRTRLRAACLQYQDGLDARGCARRGHEFAAVRDAFDIKQDGAAMGIGGEIVEHVAEIDIGHVPQ